MSELKLSAAKYSDLSEILSLQREAFRDLLIRYEDYDMNPGNEQIEDIERRFKQDNSDYWLIKHFDATIGAVRVVRNEKEKLARISPIFILPNYQGKGLSQSTFSLLEKIYSWVEVFKLDTILEEEKLCYLYEKLGYKQTGQYEHIKDGMTIVYYEKKM